MLLQCSQRHLLLLNLRPPLRQLLEHKQWSFLLFFLSNGLELNFHRTCLWFGQPATIPFKNESNDFLDNYNRLHGNFYQPNRNIWLAERCLRWTRDSIPVNLWDMGQPKCYILEHCVIFASLVSKVLQNNSLNTAAYTLHTLRIRDTNLFGC